MLHIKLTMMILFMNISLVFAMPHLVLSDNHLFEEDSNGDYILSPAFENAIKETQNEDNGLASGLLAMIDVVALIFQFIIVVIQMFVGASLILLTHLEGAMRLIIAIPVLVSYGFAIMGWLK